MIVMLTKLVEKVFEKCHRYWPNELNVSLNYGPLVLTLVKVERDLGLVTRTIKMNLFGVCYFPFSVF